MDAIVKIGIVVVIVVVFYAINRHGVSRFGRRPAALLPQIRPYLDTDSVNAQHRDELNKLINEFSMRCVNYCVYNVAIEKNLSTKVRATIFPDGNIERGEPSINLPAVFISGAGRSVLKDWFDKRGITIEEGDSINRVLAKFLLKEAEASAHRIIEKYL